MLYNIAEDDTLPRASAPKDHHVVFVAVGGRQPDQNHTQCHLCHALLPVTEHYLLGCKETQHDADFRMLEPIHTHTINLL